MSNSSLVASQIAKAISSELVVMHSGTSGTLRKVGVRIHRDIRPCNVLLVQDVNKQILSACLAGDSFCVDVTDDSGERLRPPPMPMMDVAYAAPEVLKSHNNCECSDMWAFGALLVRVGHLSRCNSCVLISTHDTPYHSCRWRCWWASGPGPTSKTKPMCIWPIWSARGT